MEKILQGATLPVLFKASAGSKQFLGQSRCSVNICEQADHESVDDRGERI